MSRIALIVLSFILGFAASTGVFAASMTVTNTADSGAGSLRQAILDANADDVHDDIVFDIPGSGPHRITPLSSLPEIAWPVTIDGYSQPGAVPNTAPVGSNAQIRIELSGPDSGSGHALVLLAGSVDSTIRGLAINRFDHSQILAIGDNCVIGGNYLGTDSSGMVMYPDGAKTRTGVEITGAGCRVGGAEPADRNVVSGNGDIGIQVSGGSGVNVQGNLIGTDRTGSGALGNACGISIGSTDPDADPISHVSVGRGAPAFRNVISGNTRCGVEIVSGEFHKIRGNLIGPSADSAGLIPNLGPGVLITGGANMNIGFAAGGSISNVIAGNAGAGVLISGDVAVAPQGIEVFGNAIHANGGLAIDLVADGVTGVTPNDEDDKDEGPNALQNFPELTAVEVTSAGTRLVGHLHSDPDSSYLIDIYAAATCGPENHGDSSIYLGYWPARTNANGDANFEAIFDDVLETGFFMSATALHVQSRQTSEYSRCIRIGDVLFVDGFDPPP